MSCMATLQMRPGGEEHFCTAPNSAVSTRGLQILGRGQYGWFCLGAVLQPPHVCSVTCRSQILGKGRYGWVLLGRYRGTSVCVKRLLPRSACKLASIFDTDGPIDAAPVTIGPDAVAASMQSGSRVAPRRKSSMRPMDGSPHGELVGHVKSVLAQPPPLLSPAASLALPDADNNFVLPAEPSSRDAQRWQRLPFFRSGWPPSRDLHALLLLARAADLVAGSVHEQWEAGA